jgi:hypothetical protein
MHLLVFLRKLRAVEIILGFIIRRDEFLPSTQNVLNRLLITTLGSEHKSLARRVGRRKRLLSGCLRKGRPGAARNQDGEPKSSFYNVPDSLTYCELFVWDLHQAFPP